MDVDLARTILSCMQNANFVPALGSTNSLIASGDPGLIADPDIQRALTQWPTLAQVLIEWQEIERNHGKMREYCLDLHWFASIEDARSTIDDWQRHYNHVRPHRSLGKKQPAVFAKEAA